MKLPSLFPSLFRNFPGAFALPVCAFLAASCSLSRAQDLSEFDVANRFYEAGKFAEAKTAYQHLVPSGPWSANLFYNLGNAEWKLGESGYAALDYQRALALQPSHPEAQANLSFVRNQTGARVIVPTWWEQALGALDPSAASILAALCAWVLLFWIAARLLWPQTRSAAGLLLMLIVLLAGAYAGGALWIGRLQAGQATVVAKSAEARVAPANTAPVSDVLPAGSQVLAPRESGPWTYGTLPNGSRAWVATGAVQRVALAQP